MPHCTNQHQFCDSSDTNTSAVIINQLSFHNVEFPLIQLILSLFIFYLKGTQDHSSHTFYALPPLFE